jgi:glycosyltransferase involved in cell wall biosynthesis
MNATAHHLRGSRCSVVIRAYNEEKHIGRLLEGILAQTVRDVEIILVDSGSTDATVSVASRYPVRVVSIAPEEFTFGRSLNRGCAAARGEWIVVASAHVYPVYPDWLEQLLAPFEDPVVALTFGKQRGSSTTKFSEHQILAAWFPEKSARVDRPFCNNANAAIRRNLWSMRPYNEEIPALEDVEWATWATAQGRSVAYVAEAEVIHVHDEDRRAVYNRYRREAMALKQIRPQEHFRVSDLARLYLSNVLMDAWHALQEGVLLAKIGEIAWFRWMQFWGTYRGFAQSGPLTRQLKDAFYYPRGLSRRRGPAGRPIAPIDYRTTRADVPQVETEDNPLGLARTRGEGRGGALRRR